MLDKLKSFYWTYALLGLFGYWVFILVIGVILLPLDLIIPKESILLWVLDPIVLAIIVPGLIIFWINRAQGNKVALKRMAVYILCALISVGIVLGVMAWAVAGLL